jgi:hypothetical protein
MGAGSRGAISTGGAGQPYSAAGHNLTLTGNSIVASDPNQILFKTLQAAVQSSVGFFSTLVSDSNAQYDPGNDKVLQYGAVELGIPPATCLWGNDMPECIKTRNRSFLRLSRTRIGPEQKGAVAAR